MYPSERAHFFYKITRVHQIGASAEHAFLKNSAAGKETIWDKALLDCGNRTGDEARSGLQSDHPAPSSLIGGR